MRMYLGDTPIRSVMTHTDTDDATMKASDLQAGVIGYSKGQKVTGSGKSFEFAFYGQLATNVMVPLPSPINVIEIACMTNPVQLSVSLSDMKNIDFSTAQEVGTVVIDGTSYPLTAQAENGILTIGCSQTVQLQVFYGKDNYT